MSLSSGGPMFQHGEARLPAVLFLLFVLAISWLVWSGLYKPLLLGLGAFSCVLSVYMANRMGFFRHQALMHLLPRLPAYWLWVLREIVSSSLNVAKLILTPSLPLDPVLVEVEAEPKSEVGQVIFGNSITLSPGTVTLDVHEGRVLVHCLTRQSALDLQAGESNRRAALLERD